jgi:uncharacterized membrane protein YeaQ/YmgE (transglycosylase-associated protein family)
MEPRGLITSLIVGALAGWIAGALARGKGFGLLMNLVLGIVGSVIGGFLFDVVGLRATGFIGSLICSVLGAMIVLWIASRLGRK